MLQIDGILSYDKNSSFLDKEKIHNIVKLIQSKYEENKLLIDQKKKEPSRSIELVKIYKLIEDLNVEISDSNKSIREFNKIIENSSLEKENLIKDMWRYIVELNSNNLKDYKRKKEILEKKLQGLKNNISKKERYKREFELEMIRYQQQITSVEHSVNEINTLLSSFGFKNFKLAAALEEGNYKIIRENGEDAKETLSEGETTFITFLYFYQLLKGSNNISEIAKEKVVVIDDPISSLDSSVLFMVSSMVRKLMFDIKENKSEIKQIFVLTHNIYFHKEVTFNQGKKSFGDGSYWILRKNNNLTSIQQYSDNPIKTSYELLWKELRNSQNQNLVSIQNIMRRILENYFKFFGNMNIDELEDNFEHEEKMICRSLLAWLNDGSHSISEDLYVESNIDVMDKYIEVFKEIFVKTNHGGHYEMMMRGYQVETVSEQEQEQDEASRQGREEISSGLREVAGGIVQS